MTAIAAPGDLDTSFGSGGLTTTVVGDHNSVIYGVAVQDDGKIVVAGERSFAGGANTAVAVARYKTDGSLDETFGTGGVTITDLTSVHDFARDVAIQDDGKIVVAGRTQGNDWDMAVLRYTGSGTLDTAFGTNGVAVVDFADNDVGTGILVQPDQRIVVTGYGTFGFEDRYFAARFLTSGSADPSFGVDGKVAVDVGAARNTYDNAIQSGGEILVVGDSVDGDVVLTVLRLTTSGTRDLSFGGTGQGVVKTNVFGSGNAARAVVVDDNDKFVVAGFARQPGGEDHAVLARYLPNGTLDTTFGTGGIAAFLPEVQGESGGAEVEAVARQSDGKYIVAGQIFFDGKNRTFLARTTGSGSLDTTFGDGGYVMTNFTSSSDKPFDAALVDETRLVTGGALTASGSARFAVARFNVEAVPQPDAKIGTKPAPSKGADVYNSAGEQTQKVAARFGRTRKVFVDIENDGPADDAFRIEGTAGNGSFSVKYFSGATDVTSDVTSGVFTSGTLAPGGTFPLEVRIKSRTPVPGRKRTVTVDVTSENDPAGTDAVVIKAKSAQP